MTEKLRRTKFEILKRIKIFLHSKEYSHSFTIHEIAKAVGGNWKTINDAILILEELNLVHVDRYKNRTLVVWI